MSTSGFILGKIGNRGHCIAKEDIKSFLKTTKKVEWTNNPTYKVATNCQVETTFSLKRKNDNNIISKYIEQPFEPNITNNDMAISIEYSKFCQKLESDKISNLDKIESNKKNISKMIDSYENTVKENIINDLKNNNNWKKALLKNQEMTILLSKYKSFLQQG